MHLALTKNLPSGADADTILLFLPEGPWDDRGAAGEVDRALDGWIRSLAGRGEISGKRNEILILYPPGEGTWRRVVLGGLGQADALTPEFLRRACGKAARRARDGGAERVVLALPEAVFTRIPHAAAAQCAAEGCLMSVYAGKTLKTAPAQRRPMQEMRFLVAEPHAAAAQAGLGKGQIYADAACTAQDLVNQPSNLLTPTALADTATALAMQEGILHQVLDGGAMEELGMGALLGVSRGSAEPPRFIVLEYEGSGAGAAASLVLVGKGITFDSGGINLKGRESMEDMKTDMAGAAAVICALQGAARLRLPLRITALIPACENMPSGKAIKPGDVLTAMNGKTIEITNTDAEGRLILADALCYAARFKPDTVIDVATLTGACVMALGEEVAAGLFCNHDDLCRRLIEAGRSQGERLWRLPLYETYKESLKSDVADLKNAGGRFGGVGVSARFLQEFTSYTWAHVDIAATATAKKERAYLPKGATGFGVRTLLAYFESCCA